MPSGYARILLQTALLGAGVTAVAASAAPELAVEVTVTAVEFDDSAKPVITEVELNLTNRSDRVIEACGFEIRFLDAKGATVMSRKHELAGLGLKPGAETLASFQDADPPKTWAHTVSVVAKCH